MRDQLHLDLANRSAPVRDEELAPGARLLRGFALPVDRQLVGDIEAVLAAAPPRHMVTRSGLRLNVALSNAGQLGWVSDRTGYRYDPSDPQTGLPWPALPASFHTLARTAAARAGFADYVPDACLINHYEPGTRLSLHQDRNERDFAHPIVSVSLGLPATFLLGGDERSDPTLRIPLEHGDVVVWGGPARLRFHGILPVKPGVHPLLGARRINLTFRRAG